MLEGCIHTTATAPAPGTQRQRRPCIVDDHHASSERCHTYARARPHRPPHGERRRVPRLRLELLRAKLHARPPLPLLPRTHDAVPTRLTAVDVRADSEARDSTSGACPLVSKARTRQWSIVLANGQRRPAHAAARRIEEDDALHERLQARAGGDA
eukprot:2366854-Prymnesium_polylepis.1